MFAGLFLSLHGEAMLRMEGEDARRSEASLRDEGQVRGLGLA